MCYYFIRSLITSYEVRKSVPTFIISMLKVRKSEFRKVEWTWAHEWQGLELEVLKHVCWATQGHHSSAYFIQMDFPSFASIPSFKKMWLWITGIEVWVNPKSNAVSSKSDYNRSGLLATSQAPVASAPGLLFFADIYRNIWFRRNKAHCKSWTYIICTSSVIPYAENARQESLNF